MPKIFVKWGTKKFEVDVSTELEPLVLKSQLFELTGVLPKKQRVLIKGKQLPDDNWNGITIQEGLTIMLMGTVEEAVLQISKIEDEKEVIMEEEKLIVPVGLKNLGNTCYMNACLQAFKVIPELMYALKNYSGNNNSFVATSKKLYDDLDRLEKNNYYNSETGGKHFIPFFLLNVLHVTFAQFSTRNSSGQLQQQDANECFSEVLRILSGETEVLIGGANRLAGISDDEESTVKLEKSIKTSRIFETEFDVTLKCLETEEEPVENVHEKHLQISCFLNQDVRYIKSGIKSRLTEEIEKHSQFLNRDAKFQKKSLISRLPEYLCIQMVRFFYKKKDKINAKILKDVKFPINFDIYELCTPALQEKLHMMRDRYKVYDDKIVEKMRQSKLNDNLIDFGKNQSFTKKYTKDTKFWSNSFISDPGSNNSGFYELKAVITHKGRSSQSGHYVAWVRINHNNWAMCDDDEIHPISEEEVLKLSGGGDWHCAYVLIYGPRLLPIENNSNEDASNLKVSENEKIPNSKESGTKMEVN